MEAKIKGLDDHLISGGTLEECEEISPETFFNSLPEETQDYIHNKTAIGLIDEMIEMIRG